MKFQATCRKCNKLLKPKGIQEMKDGSKIMSFEKDCNCGITSIIWIEVK